MPIYEYSCRACGEETERLQKLSEPDWVDCPSCGKPELYRTVSAAGFRLAGSGWYETDFKKDGKRNLSGDDGNSGASSGSTSGTKSESGNDSGKSSEKSSSSADSSSKNSSKNSNSSESKSTSKPAPKSKPNKKSESATTK